MGSVQRRVTEEESARRGAGLTAYDCGTIAAVSTPPTVRDVLVALERFAPRSRAAGWDPVGLSIGDPDAPVRTAAVCHEITDRVASGLAADPVDLVVTYHPLLFDPVASLVAGPHPGGRALRLAAAGVAVAVAHTNVDVAPGGAADALADAVGITGAAGFGPLHGAGTAKVVTFVPHGEADAVADAMAEAGAGTIGAYRRCSFRSEGTGTFFAPKHAAPAAGAAGALNREPEVRVEMVAPAGRVDAVVGALVAAHPYEEPAYDVVERWGEAGFVGRVGALAEPVALGVLAQRAADRLGGVVRVAGEADRPVRSVAAVPGSGGGFVEAAAATGADVLVTGDVSHHRARAAEDLGLAVIDPGHAATERPGVARLYAAVAAIVPNTTERGSGDADPWRSP
jgi:dinuclear metal center YbgI/SA1388 family protein